VIQKQFNADHTMLKPRNTVWRGWGFGYCQRESIITSIVA